MSKVTELESRLDAGRSAMCKLQTTILGKSGQRFAIMAADLEKTVDDFNVKQMDIARRESLLLERSKEVFEREDKVTAREDAASAVEAAQKEAQETLDAQGRKVCMKSHTFGLVRHMCPNQL